MLPSRLLLCSSVQKDNSSSSIWASSSLSKYSTSSSLAVPRGRCDILFPDIVTLTPSSLSCLLLSRSCLRSPGPRTGCKGPSLENRGSSSSSSELMFKLKPRFELNLSSSVSSSVSSSELPPFWGAEKRSFRVRPPSLKYCSLTWCTSVMISWAKVPVCMAVSRYVPECSSMGRKSRRWRPTLTRSNESCRSEE